MFLCKRQLRSKSVPTVSTVSGLVRHLLIAILVCLSAGNKGLADAPVTVEFFAARQRFSSFPLALHLQAGLAHDAATDAAGEGRFLKAAAYIESLCVGNLTSSADKLCVDAFLFAGMNESHKYTPRVHADLVEGRITARRHPGAFVNVKRIDGMPNIKMLTEYVETVLASKYQEVEQRKIPSCL